MGIHPHTHTHNTHTGNTQDKPGEARTRPGQNDNIGRTQHMTDEAKTRSGQNDNTGRRSGLRPRSSAEQLQLAAMASSENPQIPSHKLSRKAAQLRWESQTWDSWESPVSYASLKTPSQPAPLYVGNRKAPKIFKSAQKSPYVISTVEPSQTDGGSALSDVEVFFEDEQGDETEKDKVTAEKCILRGAQLVNAAIGKKKRVLVHCYAGQNRSASICAAYFILYRGWAPGKAIAHVRHRVEVDREVLDVVQNPCFAQILKRLTPAKR